MKIKTNLAYTDICLRGSSTSSSTVVHRLSMGWSYGQLSSWVATVIITACCTLVGQLISLKQAALGDGPAMRGDETVKKNARTGGTTYQYHWNGGHTWWWTSDEGQQDGKKTLHQKQWSQSCENTNENILYTDCCSKQVTLWPIMIIVIVCFVVLVANCCHQLLYGGGMVCYCCHGEGIIDLVKVGIGDEMASSSWAGDKLLLHTCYNY